MPFSHIFQCLFLATHGEEKLRRSFPFQGENKKCAQNYSATFRPATTILMKLFSALTHLAIHPLLALLAHLAHLAILAILDVRVLMKSQELNRLRAQQRASYPENSHNIINNVGKVEETCRLCGNGSEMVAELFVESTKPVQQSAAPSVLARFHKISGKIHAQQHSTKNVKSYK